MPIISGNEPTSRKPKPQGSGWAWLIPFVLVFGRPIYQTVRNLTTGRITDQQLIIIGAGVVALVVLALIIQRINRAREGSATRLPTSYTPSAPALRPTTDQQFVPSAPRFEPIITGKVVIAGLILAGVMGLAGVLLLLP